MKGRHGSRFFWIVLFGTLILFGLSAIVMYLWNFALVPALDLGLINLWQAMAILVLSKILFTGIRPRHKSQHQPPWKRWHNLSEEDRSTFKERWKEHCEKRD